MSVDLKAKSKLIKARDELLAAIHRPTPAEEELARLNGEIARIEAEEFTAMKLAQQKAIKAAGGLVVEREDRILNAVQSLRPLMSGYVAAVDDLHRLTGGESMNLSVTNFEYFIQDIERRMAERNLFDPDRG